MSNTLKIFGVVAAVGVAAAATYVVVKKQEEKKNYIPETEDGEEAVVVDKKETVVDQVKLAAQKKVIKIFAWVVLHKDKIEALGVLLGIISGVFGVISAAKEYYTGAKLRRKIDQLCAYTDEFREAWNKSVDIYDSNFEGLKNTVERIETALQKGA